MARRLSSVFLVYADASVEVAGGLKHYKSSSTNNDQVSGYRGCRVIKNAVDEAANQGIYMILVRGPGGLGSHPAVVAPFKASNLQPDTA